jgi:endopeptidase Clp ATP-binding regulatory subunit ClpX
MQTGMLNPADIQRDFKEFLEKKYGAQVSVTGIPQPAADGGGEGIETETKAHRIDFDLKPEELEAYLDEYVVQQREAKEVLATKICTHFHRMKLDRESGDDEEGLVGGIKNNIILAGPTGVGKTYLIKLIARRIGVPFVKGDATKFSETGYVGGDVEDLVRDLVREAGGDIELAQYGIIYIDEIDKIAASGTVVGPDVSRTGVQRNLLKLMEETEVDLKAPHDLASQMESLMQLQRTGKVERKRINTRNILFIVSGAFAGVEEIIRRRLNRGAMGFASGSEGRERPRERAAILRRMRTEDLLEYGFESEFIGRLPIVTVLNPLDADDLYAILKNPKSSVITSKKRDFRAYGIELGFEDEALRKMARLAHEEKTGARGLVSVCERVLLKFEKRLPSTGIRRLVVTEAVVEDPEAELGRLLVLDALRRYREAFFNAYRIALDFDDEAAAAIAQRSEALGTTPDVLCQEQFAEYGHGLKLLGKEQFTVRAEVLRDPKTYLNELIKAHYSKEKG